MQQFRLQLAQKEATITNLQCELLTIAEEKKNNDTNIGIQRNMLNIIRADRDRLQKQIQAINNMSSNAKNDNYVVNETMATTTTTTSVAQPSSSSLSFSISSSIVCEPTIGFERMPTETKTIMISTTFPNNATTTNTTTNTNTTNSTIPIPTTSVPSNVNLTQTMNIDEQRQESTLEQQKIIIPQGTQCSSAA